MIGIDEDARLDALQQLNLLDTPPNQSFDRVTRMASQLFDLPIAAVSLTDRDRQWFKSRVGVDHTTIPRHKAPCSQVAESREVLIISDLLADPNYRDSPLAQNGVRFYAGAPLTTADGYGLGAMCVLGTQPRQVTQSEVETLNDLAAMVMSQIELQHAFGRIDPISGMPNRTQFFEDLDDLARDHAPGQRRLVMLVDLIASDQLSHATRVMGPTVIDTMIKEAARHFRALIGSQKAYHVGVTQFACLAPAALDEWAYIDLLTEKSDQFHGLGDFRSSGIPAVGVAPFVLGELPSVDVLRIAQGAAQDARAAGKLFSVHSVKQDTKYQRSFALLHAFEAAIQAPRDLSLAYQPRVDLATGRCIGAEALLRWTHPDLGAISPAEFIPLIEKMTLATPTTAWVLDTAAAQLARWAKRGWAIGVSVNISAANLREADFAETVKRTLAKHDVSPEALELEITETAVMDDAERALVQLERLASAGIRLAIDDFGTGYSSLSYLQRLPVHVVKIDQSFIKDLDTNPRQLSLVTTMITMSKGFGHRVVAEGVENQAIVDRLRTTACDEVQGYFFARPMPAEQFVHWLAERGGTPGSDLLH